MPIDLDAIARKYDTRRWPSVVHMNGRLLAPKETPEDVAALIDALRETLAFSQTVRELAKQLPQSAVASAVEYFDKTWVAGPGEVTAKQPNRGQPT